MKASSKKSTVPQGLDSSASEQAVVFAFSVLAAAGVRLRHHQFLERDEFGLNRREFPNSEIFWNLGCWLRRRPAWMGRPYRTIFVSGRSERFSTADFRAIERRLSSALGSARSSTGCGGFTRRAAWRRARRADTSRRRSATGTRLCPSAFGKEPSRCAGWWRNSPGAGSRSTIARCGISSTRRSSVFKKKRRGERARTARRRAKAGAMEEASGPDRARASGVH